MIGARLRSIRHRALLPLAALGLAAVLGGCIAYPAYPGYGYSGDGYGYPYYGGYPSTGYVEFGTGWGWRGDDHGWGGHHDWGDRR